MTGVDSGDRSVIFARMGMTEGSLIVAASVTIHEGFSWQVQMQDRIIPPQQFYSVDLTSVSAISNLITTVNSRSICCGNPDEKFLPLVKARKGKFMDSSGSCLMCTLCCFVIMAISL